MVIHIILLCVRYWNLSPSCLQKQPSMNMIRSGYPRRCSNVHLWRGWTWLWQGRSLIVPPTTALTDQHYKAQHGSLLCPAATSVNVQKVMASYSEMPSLELWRTLNISWHAPKSPTCVGHFRLLLPSIRVTTFQEMSATSHRLGP